MKHPSSAMALRHAGSNPLQWLWLSGLMLLSLLFLSPAWAADDEEGAADDPPARVGRIAETEGTVWVFAPESGEWIEAARNRPLTTGDRLSADRDGRAVVRIGSDTTVRIDNHTELEVLALDDEKISFRLHSGSMSARLRSREAAREFSVVTDEGRFLPSQSGSYRVDRFDDTSHATVFDGQMRFEGGGTSLAMNPGNRVEFWKEAADKPPKYQFAEVRQDAFAAWVTDNDVRDGRTVSTTHVSPDMTGVEDLDRYGRWEQTPEYGSVWIPRAVAVDWAPYRAGHWAWVAPWGWTWIDDAPWGFAPFHYGRWVNYRNAWCWAPGSYIRRPVYAPALVAWVGGPHFGVSIGIGPAVGWFPLGPREVYVPRYRSSPRYIRQVNVTHVTNINVNNVIHRPDDVTGHTRYRNRDVHNAMTVVPASVMERRQPVGPSARRVDDRTLREMSREHVRADAPFTPRGAPGVRRPGDSRSAGIGPAPAPRTSVPPSPAEIARPAIGREGPNAGQRRSERPDDRARQDDRPGRDRDDARERNPGARNGGFTASTMPNPTNPPPVVSGNPSAGAVTGRPAAPQPSTGGARREDRDGRPDGRPDNDRARAGNGANDRGPDRNRDERRPGPDNARPNPNAGFTASTTEPPVRRPSPSIAPPAPVVRPAPPAIVHERSTPVPAPPTVRIPQPPQAAVQARPPEMRERPGPGPGNGDARFGRPPEDRQGGGGDQRRGGGNGGGGGGDRSSGGARGGGDR